MEVEHWHISAKTSASFPSQPNQVLDLELF